MIVDPFCGAGGWAEAAASLGMASIGLDLDADACASHRAAGHLTVRADVASYPAERFAGRVDGMVASPPCTAFSKAGKRMGHLDGARIHSHALAVRGGWFDPGSEGWHDPTSRLVLEPLRWTDIVRPLWLALEQVDDVLPMWQTTAEVLRAWGYSVWCGVLSAEQYGVPQSRRRAILVAHAERAASAPPPTHQRYESGVPARAEEGLFGGLKPWVSMAEALGWDGDAAVGFPRQDDRGDSPDGYRERDWRPADQPSFALTEKTRSWSVRTGSNSMKHSRRTEDVVPYERSCDTPAPTVDGKAGSAWRLRSPASTLPNDRTRPRTPDEPANTLAFGHGNFVWERLHTRRDQRPDGSRQTRASDQPAPTVAGVGSQWEWETRAVEISELLVLQSFRPDYPLQGSKTSRHRQVGNAVPPLLGRAVIDHLVNGGSG